MVQSHRVPHMIYPTLYYLYHGTMCNYSISQKIVKVYEAANFVLFRTGPTVIIYPEGAGQGSKFSHRRTDRACAHAYLQLADRTAYRTVPIRQLNSRANHERTKSAPRANHECTKSAPRVYQERTSTAPAQYRNRTAPHIL